MQEQANPVHMISGPETRWTTVNFGEAIQGVQTPLSWAIWDYGMEHAFRRALYSMGVLGAADAPPPADPGDRMSGIFYGRAAGNINFMRMLGERMPGSSGDLIEEKLFGDVSGTPSWGPPASRSRTGVVLAKLPRAAFRAPRVLPGMLQETRAWWRANVLDQPPQTLEQAGALARQAAERFAVVGAQHTIVSVIGPQLLDTLTGFAAAATGEPALGMDLATGFGGMEETQIIADLWAAARGALTVAEIQRRHGFHGPNEGQLDSRSWREDPAGVHAILRGYTSRGTADPRERERDQLARRQRATGLVLTGLPRFKRPQARLAIKLASIYIPARELGKAAFLHDLDAARCSARVGGAILAERGLLADPEDVFFLTLEEFAGSPDESFLQKTAERKANHQRYLGLALPPAWNGNPAPTATSQQPHANGRVAVTSLSGIGVVGAQVTGRARVVSDPVLAELDDGDILVCATTDPSWTPLFMLVSALVIDTGGQMSHGAIVARELGVCCVINTVTGTRDIPDGATIRVDGALGTVEILSE
ncbi:MAG: PEP-utilizing enzyme [Solirubrobacteraceae bacterium]